MRRDDRWRRRSEPSCAARAGLAAAALLAVAAVWLLLGIYQALRAGGAPAWAASLAMGAISTAAGLALRRRARRRAKT